MFAEKRRREVGYREACMKRIWLVILLAVTLVTGCSRQNSLSDRDRAIAAIDAQRIHEVTAELASAIYGGRRTGTPGEAKVAAWIAGAWKEAGLDTPEGVDDYLLQYEAPLYSITAFSGVTARGVAGESFLGDRSRAMPYAGNGSVEASAVLVGFGVTTAEHDEYAGVDVGGKIAVIFRYSPPSWSIPEEQAYLAAKIQRAAAHGAVGVVILDVPSSPNPFDMRGQTVSAIQDAPPSILVSVEGARSLLWAAGMDFDVFAAEAWAGRGVSRDLKLTVHYAVSADWNPVASAYDVLGVVPGRDADRKILLCAHHDHLGTDRTGTVYPGADDDASGVAVLLEVARCLSRTGTPPVSVWFVSFSGEEEGLIGSQALVAALPDLRETLIGVVNLDMMRRTSSALGVSVAAGDIRMMAAVQAAIGDGAALSIIPWTLGSDHATFNALGVSSCMVSGHGREVSWYHAASDIASDIPAADLGSAARNVLHLLWRLMESM